MLSRATTSMARSSFIQTAHFNATHPSYHGWPDYGVDINDLLYFVGHYGLGC